MGFAPRPATRGRNPSTQTAQSQSNAAYGQPSTQVWTLPPLETAAGSAPAPPTTPNVALVAIRATAVRATPDPGRAVVIRLAAGSIRSLNSAALVVKVGGADRLRALADSVQLAGPDARRRGAYDPQFWPDRPLWVALGPS